MVRHRARPVGLSCESKCADLRDGGFAYGRLTRDDTYTYVDPVNCPIPFSCATQTNSIAAIKPGWTVGAGIETKLWGNWSGRIEYLYMELDGLGTSVFSLSNGNPAVVLTTTSHEFTDSILRVGLNYEWQ